MDGKQIPEMNYLMSHVEKKLRKNVKTSTDFIALAGEIENETGALSASTLKRIWGYVNMNPVPRESTLDVLVRYIGKNNYKSFCEELKNSKAFNSEFFTADFINSRDLKSDDYVEIGWAPDRLVTLKFLGDSQFEVESSHNSKLNSGDRFTAANFIKGHPLFISRILRNGDFTPSYIASRQGGLTLLRKLYKRMPTPN